MASASATNRPLRDFDTVGAGLITSGMLLLVYVLVNAPSVGWGTARTLGELAGALALVVLFVFNEQGHSNPLVPLSLFKIKGLGAADVTQILAMAGFLPAAIHPGQPAPETARQEAGVRRYRALHASKPRLRPAD